MKSIRSEKDGGKEVRTRFFLRRFTALESVYVFRCSVKFNLSAVKDM